MTINIQQMCPKITMYKGGEGGVHMLTVLDIHVRPTQEQGAV